MRQRQRLGGQQDQGHGHLGPRGDGAAGRQHQQRQQEAVLLRDHVPQRAPGPLQLFGHRRPQLELLLHQHAHVRARADLVQEPGGVEAHTHQRGLRVRAEPQVVAGVTSFTHGRGRLAAGGQTRMNSSPTAHSKLLVYVKASGPRACAPAMGTRPCIRIRLELLGRPLEHLPRA